MADRTVMLRIGANISGLQSQMRAAQASVADFSKKSVSHIEKNSASIDTLSNSVGVVGAGLTALAATAVTRFAQFDKAMSSVAATGDDARGSLDALRQAAVTAGADTAFSAAEAAGAIEQLAKAGVSSADILGGGLTGALSLAAAGEIEVGQAAEIAASALTQFSLKGTDVGHVADLLAAGAGKAQGGVADMGAALNQSGLIAAQVGLSIEETTGALSAMASAGLTGSDAGTSLKTSLIALSSPSAEAAKEMERLGISAYDANGNFVGMEALAGNLQTQLSGLSDEQRNAALATIFGSDALRTANVLYKEGASGIAEWTAAVDDQGYAAETAAAQTDNLIGDVERLGGSLDSVLIQSGSGANDALRGLVQGAESVVDAFGKIPAPILSAGALIAGGGGLVALGVAGMGKLATSTVAARGAMVDLGIVSDTTAGRIQSGLGKTAKVAAGAATAIGGIALAYANAAGDVDQGTNEILANIDTLAAGGESAETVFDGVSGALGTMQRDGVPLKQLISDLADPNLWEQFNGGVSEVAVGLGNMFGADWRASWQAQRDALAAYDEQLALVATQDLPTATAAFRALHDEVGGTEAAGSQLLQVMPGLRDALVGQASALGMATDDASLLKIALGDVAPAQEDAAAATEGATSAIEDNSEAIRKNLSLAAEAAGVVLSERDAQRSLEAAFDDATAAIKDNGKTLDSTTEKGRANQSALDAVADGAWDVMESMYDAGASSKQLSARMGEARDAFIRTATSAGATKAEARALADDLGLIPSDVETIIKARDNASGTIRSVRVQLESLRDQTVYITTVRRNATERAQRGSAGNNDAGFSGGGYTGPGGKYEPKGIVHAKEFVVRSESTQSIEAAAPGLLSAMNRMGAGALGLGGFASGGAVGQAARQVSVLRSRLRSARRGRASDAAVERLEAQLDEANARLDRLRDESATLRTDLRRGNIRNSVSGGLSGALGVTDQLRDLASSGDVSRFGSRRLNNVAGSAEKALTSLYKQAERIDNRIESATDSLQKWQGIADGVSSSISGAFSLGDVSGGVNPWSGKEQQATGQQLLSASLAYQTKARNLVLKLRALQAAGYGTAILQEVAAQGVDGGVAMADALLSLSPADAKALQASQAAIGFYAGRAGIAATDDQVTAAARALEAAEAQGRMIDKNIDRWASRLGSAMARALGIKARASGGPVMAGSAYLVGENGPELHVPSRSGYVVNAAQTATSLGRGGPTYTFNITNIHPVAEPASVTTNRALATAASTGRF